MFSETVSKINYGSGHGLLVFLQENELGMINMMVEPVHAACAKNFAESRAVCEVP